MRKFSSQLLTNVPSFVHTVNIFSELFRFFLFNCLVLFSCFGAREPFSFGLLRVIAFSTSFELHVVECAWQRPLQSRGIFFSLRPVLGCVLNFEKRREFPIKSNRKPHFFTVRLALVLACFFYVRFGVTAFFARYGDEVNESGVGTLHDAYIHSHTFN